jgi:hypothetical protein
MGVKCHFLNFGSKSENMWILQEGKMYFPLELIKKKNGREKEKFKTYLSEDRGRSL